MKAEWVDGDERVNLLLLFSHGTHFRQSQVSILQTPPGSTTHDLLRRTTSRRRLDSPYDRRLLLSYCGCQIVRMGSTS